ncbi:N-formylglutamate amidohydrolase [Chloroflexota bacterium]
MKFRDLLVVVPHSGIIIPWEMPVSSLSVDFQRLLRNVDWYTDWLYDFRDMLGNSQITFPYCNLVLEGNRDPAHTENSVPLKDILNETVYRQNMEPDIKVRRFLSKKYLRPFHRDITKQIAGGMAFMLDGHSTVTAQGLSDNQIELMNFQTNKVDGKITYFCPDMFIETYANELTKLLPSIKVTVNESRYHMVYGHVCGKHSTGHMNRYKNRVPAILQETNQLLYMNADKTPNLEALETLRRAFAEALYKMVRKIKRL